MTLYWKDYGSFPRLASVVNTEIDGDILVSGDKGERLIIGSGKAVFQSDSYSMNIDDDSPFRSLRTGDVISIDDRGIVYVQFVEKDNDACLFITGHCNSNCVMCPSSDSERRCHEDITFDWFQRFLALLPLETVHFTVTGGEPTLNTELFFRVMALVADKFPDAETLLLTNGRSFAARSMMNRLVEHCPQYLRVAVPLHGPSSQIHDRITQATGSFRETSIGIRNLLDAGIAVELRVVVSKLNYMYLTEIADYIIKNFSNALVVNFIGLETRGSCAKNYNTVYITLPDAACAAIPAIDKLTCAGIDAALYNFPLCAVDRGYWSICRNSISPDKIRYPAECEACEAKLACGGFFSTTLSMAKPTVHPIHF